MLLDFKLVNNTLIVSISGEMDHHTSEDIRDRIDNQIDGNPVKNVIFDFTNVNFMDSAGIGIIIGRYRKISTRGGSIAIVNEKPQIGRILEVSGILKITKICKTVDSALLCV
jgi:stage II sporulation protein AA (anti-sigma F factor antagonist)